MDKASQALARGVRPGVRRSYRTLADHSEEKAKGQRYLRDYEEAALIQYLLQLSDLGQPVRIKFIPSLAFCITRQRSTNRPPKPPHEGWSKDLEKRYPEIKARRVRALEWNRHEKNIYGKTTH
ncbi:uncharacterized protein BDR25DRAFT_181412, partial [Lindgomyces ingoldianus]